MDRSAQYQPPLNRAEDKFTWRLSANGKYSLAIAYKALSFLGTVEINHARVLRKKLGTSQRKYFLLAFTSKPLLYR
jgi:hypothetical protein